MRAESPRKTSRERIWSIGCVIAVALFAIGASFSIFLIELGAFSALLLTLVNWPAATRPLRDNPLLAAGLSFYFLIQIFSIVYSQHPLRSLICLRGDWPVLFLPLMIFVLQKRSTLVLGLSIFIGSASLAGAYGLWQHLTGIDPLGKVILESDLQGGHFAVGTLGGHLTYGGVMMFAVVASFSLLITTGGRRRFWLLAATGLCGAGLIASYARTAWFGAGIGIGVAILTAALRNRTSKSDQFGFRTILPGLVIVLACIALLCLTPGLRDRFLDLGNFAQKPRLRLWETALRIFNQFPLFGAGLGAYKSHFSQFCVPGVYKATGHPHNDLLNLLVHSGLAGLVAWCLLWYAVLHSGIYKLVKGAKDIGAQITLSSYSTIPLLFATVATLFAGGMAQCYFTDEEPAAAFWFLIAIAITTATNERTRREESELRVQTAPGDIR